MPCCTVKHEQAAWTAFTELMYSNTTDNCDWLQTAVGDDGDNDVRDVHLCADRVDRHLRHRPASAAAAVLARPGRLGPVER